MKLLRTIDNGVPEELGIHVVMDSFTGRIDRYAHMSGRSRTTSSTTTKTQNHSFGPNLPMISSIASSDWVCERLIQDTRRQHSYPDSNPILIMCRSLVVVGVLCYFMRKGRPAAMNSTRSTAAATS